MPFVITINIKYIENSIMLMEADLVPVGYFRFVLYRNQNRVTVMDFVIKTVSVAAINVIILQKEI